jgi:hypothetical protein
MHTPSGKRRTKSSIVGLLLPQPKPVKRNLRVVRKADVVKGLRVVVVIVVRKRRLYHPDLQAGEVPAPFSIQGIEEELLLVGERKHTPFHNFGVQRRKAGIGAGRRRRWRGVGCFGVVLGSFSRVAGASCSDAHLFPAK